MTLETKERSRRFLALDPSRTTFAVVTTWLVFHSWLKGTVLINFPAVGASGHSALVIFDKSHLFPNTSLNYSGGREAMLSLARNFLGLPLTAFAGGEETKDKVPCPYLWRASPPALPTCPSSALLGLHLSLRRINPFLPSSPFVPSFLILLGLQQTLVAWTVSANPSL